MENIDESLTIDEVLRALIGGSDLIEVACCLDMIAEETGCRVMVYEGTEVVYPKDEP